jgi:hypothetical protein
MSSEKLEWITIKGIRGQKGQDVGALAYSDGQLVAVVAFHAANDFNQDGKVTLGERVQSFLPLVGNENQVMASVINAAYSDPDILVRGGGITEMRGKAITSLGFSLIAEGVYLTYFRSPVSTVSGALAKQITSGMVKQIVVKQGFSALFKKGYEATTPSY